MVSIEFPSGPVVCHVQLALYQNSIVFVLLNFRQDQSCHVQFGLPKIPLSLPFDRIFVSVIERDIATGPDENSNRKHKDDGIFVTAN
jgi:hypothetical protein